MPCYSPLSGFMRQDPHGQRKFVSHISDRKGGNYYNYTPQTVPCGGCSGCRATRARTWAIRVMHEASLYTHNCFVTLTYAPEHLPKNNSLYYPDFQQFMKRLREAHKGCDSVSHPYYGQIDNHTGKPFPEFYKPIRHYTGGEYGENFGRPHFHTCLFNINFPDMRVHKRTPAGKLIYTSKILQELWPLGFSSIGELNFASAGYVARYIFKKRTGKNAHEYYETVDDNGVVDYRVPEFNKMSLKPGIAAGWFKKFPSDVYKVAADGHVHQDFVVINGKKVKPPRYYDNLFKLKNPFEWNNIEYERWLNSQNNLDDSTPERLLVREQVHLAQLSKLKRSLT